MMQSVLPCLLFGKCTSTVEFKGGVNGSKAPSIEYFLNVLQPKLSNFGINLTLEVKKKSYLPPGGAVLSLTVSPVRQLRCYELIERGEVEKIQLTSFFSGTVSVEVPQRIVHDALKRMEEIIKTEKVKKQNIICEIVKESKALGSSAGLLIVTETTTGGIFSSFSSGGRGVNAEKISRAATNVAIRNVFKGGAIDEFLQDQILIYCVLAKGNSKIRTGPLTPHTMSMINLLRLMCGANISIIKTKLENRTQIKEKSYILDIHGVGWVNSNNSKK